MVEAWTRYATAFAQSTFDDPVSLEALGAWKKRLDSVPELSLFLSRRDIPISVRNGILSSVAQGKLGKSERFLSLLVERNLIGDFEAIYERVRAECLRMSGTVPVLIESAGALDEKELDSLRTWLEEQLGTPKIKLNVRIDRELIAGFVIHAESRRIDMSIRGRLSRLDRVLRNE